MLLDKDLLFSKRENLLKKKVFARMDSKKFTDSELIYDYDDKKILLILVRDNMTWKAIKKPYNEKVCESFFIITRSELEILMIHAANLYTEYAKTKQKPSIFLAEKFQIKTARLKSKDYIEDFYEQYSLIDAIVKYKQVTKFKKNEYCLANLLKDDSDCIINEIIKTSPN